MNGWAMTGKKLIFKNVFILPKLSIIYPYAKTENNSPLFFGSIIKNAAQNTLHGVFFTASIILP